MPAVLATERAVSSPNVAKTIDSTHCTYPWKDGQAEWAWIYTGMVHMPKVVTNPSTNRARRSFTSTSNQPLHGTGESQSEGLEAQSLLAADA